MTRYKLGTVGGRLLRVRELLTRGHNIQYPDIDARKLLTHRHSSTANVGLLMLFMHAHQTGGVGENVDEADGDVADADGTILSVAQLKLTIRSSVT